MGLEREKIAAAMAAVKLVESGMIVGLGSGSTSSLMIKQLGKQVSKGLRIKGVASSTNSEKLAIEVGIPLIALEEAKRIDLNIDGADEFNLNLQLIKGGGGALLREKIIAHNSSMNVIIADSSKESQNLGHFKLPIETIPFATSVIFLELGQLGLKPNVRKNNGNIYETDGGNNILDLNILDYRNLQELEGKLRSIPGVVETGLFLNSTDLIIYGKGDTAKEIRRN